MGREGCNGRNEDLVVLLFSYAMKKTANSDSEKGTVFWLIWRKVNNCDLSLSPSPFTEREDYVSGTG